jgi:hypothetical protein
MRNHVRSGRRVVAVALAAGALALTAATTTGGSAGAAPAAAGQAATTYEPVTTTGPTTIPGGTATTVPPTGRADELCTRRGIPPRLRHLLARLFHVRCAPGHPATTTTTTTRGGPVRGCGTFDTAAGWPTTFARPRNDCLLTAFASGTPAMYLLYTAPSPGDTRRIATTYEVIGVQRVRVTVDTTGWGGTTITVSECTGLTDNGFNLQTTGCDVVETRTVTVAPTETRLVVAPVGPVVAGQPVTLTATVVTADGTPVTTGTVTLVEGDEARGTLPPNPDGAAAFTITRPVGIWYFHARYNGSRGFAPSTADAVRFEVVPA